MHQFSRQLSRPSDKVAVGPAAARKESAERRSASAYEEELKTEHLIGDISRRSVRGGAWTVAGQAVKLIAQFGAVVILARSLPPTAFGLVAMVVAINTVLDPLKELGLSSATIQRTDITHGEVSTLFWVNTAVGALIALALSLAAPAIAHLYGHSELVPITRWLSLGFLIGGLGAQHWALLRRQMRFGEVAVLEAGAEIAGFAVAITMAVAGAGLWALVAQRLVSPALLVTGCWTLCRWRPALPQRSKRLGQLLTFGASLSATAVLGTFSRSVDQIVVGLVWGPVSLGLYERASRLMMVPQNNIWVPFYSVGMPMLSRLHGSELKYRQAFNELIEKLAMLMIPAAACIALIADGLTELLFGPQWMAAAPLVACFGVALAYQPLIIAIGLLYMSQNRPREVVRASIIDVILTVLSLAIGLPFGVVGVAVALVTVGVAIRTPIAFYLATRAGPVRQTDIYTTIAPAVLAALPVAASVWLLRSEAPDLISEPLGAVASAFTLAVIVAAATYCTMPKTRRAMIGLVRLPRLLSDTGEA